MSGHEWLLSAPRIQLSFQQPSDNNIYYWEPIVVPWIIFFHFSPPLPSPATSVLYPTFPVLCQAAIFAFFYPLNSAWLSCPSLCWILWWVFLVWFLLHSSLMAFPNSDGRTPSIHLCIWSSPSFHYAFKFMSLCLSSFFSFLVCCSDILHGEHKLVWGFFCRILRITKMRK